MLVQLRAGCWASIWSHKMAERQQKETVSLLFYKLKKKNFGNLFRFALKMHFWRRRKIDKEILSDKHEYNTWSSRVKCSEIYVNMPRQLCLRIELGMGGRGPVKVIARLRALHCAQDWQPSQKRSLAHVSNPTWLTLISMICIFVFLFVFVCVYQDKNERQSAIPKDEPCKWIQSYLIV